MKRLRILQISWASCLVLAYSLARLSENHVERAAMVMGALILVQLLAAIGTVRNARLAWLGSLIFSGLWFLVSLAFLIVFPVNLIGADPSKRHWGSLAYSLIKLFLLVIAPSVWSMWLFFRHRTEIFPVLQGVSTRAMVKAFFSGLAVVTAVVGAALLIVTLYYYGSEWRRETPGQPAYFARVTGISFRVDAPVVVCRNLDFGLYEFPVPSEVLAKLGGDRKQFAEYPRKAGYQEKHVLAGWHPAPPQLNESWLMVSLWDGVNLTLQGHCEPGQRDVSDIRDRLRSALDRPTTWLAYSYYGDKQMLGVLSFYALDFDNGVLYDIEYAR